MRSSTQRSGGRRSFTLLELLMVLAILSLVAAMVWPAMRRQLAKTQLRGAARQVRVELSRARCRAVESGTVYGFRYRLETGHFQLAPLASADGEEADFDGEQKGRHISGYDRHRDAVPSDPIPDGSEAGGVVEHVLPEGIVFAPDEPLELQTAVDSPIEPATADDLAGDTPASDALSKPDGLETHAETWSPPVLFYPNGRTSNAVIHLRNDLGSRISVSLRSLTGVAAIGPLERQEKRR
jgi:prepilin-type N-terminal cleavage/methylation domain-containing protein